MAIACAGLTVELREVLLRIKPETMLAISPKGTVPVLQLAGGQVIDESIEIMRWALSFSDPDGWLEASAGCEDDSAELVVWNDGGFKHYLDRYKYADRFPENARDFYRGMAEPFLLELECRLSSNPYLFGSRLSLTDVAVFPFVRQFAGVDGAWFRGSRYRAVRAWLQEIVGEIITGSSDVRIQKDGSYLVDASVTLRDLNRLTGWSFPTKGPKTLNGLIIEFLETIPVRETSLVLSGYRLEILEVDEHAVQMVKFYAPENQSD